VTTSYNVTVSEWAKTHRVPVRHARKVLEQLVKIGRATKELVQRDTPLRSRNQTGLKFYVYKVTK